MGLKKMLAQGIADEVEQLNKASVKASIKTGSLSEPENLKVENENKETKEPVLYQKPETEIKVTAERNRGKSGKKKTRGRPTNKDLGIDTRKQYTLTLREGTYKLIVEKAREADMSFAKFMERAALEYIENH